DQTFWDHADVLRKYLIRSILIILILSIAAFFFKDFLFNTIILGPKHPDFITYRFFCALGKYLHVDGLCFDEIPFILINIDIGGQFRWHMIISIVTGVIVGFPIILYQLWLFIKPALKPNELKYSRGMIFYITILFLLGVLFGYYIILPLTINFLANYELSSQIKNQITISSYISTTTWLPILTGLVFELPVLIYFLAKIGLITAKFLRKNRKYSIILILFIAALITPSTDMFTQLVVSVPFYALYEISISIAARVDKKRQQEE
ncbi:MAG: twin-arginine translocase subunit TatC, partial [Bacteroidota bacterium]